MVLVICPDTTLTSRAGSQPRSRPSWAAAASLSPQGRKNDLHAATHAVEPTRTTHRFTARLAFSVTATILGCGALMLAGFAGNLGAAVWSATAVAVLAWLAIPVWVLALGRTLVRPRSVLPETATVAV